MESLTFPIVIPPTHGESSFLVRSKLTAFDRYLLNQEYDDDTISTQEEWCVGLLYDLDGAGGLRVINHSHRPAYIAKLVPGCFLGASFRRVRAAALNPEGTYVGAGCAAAIPGLPSRTVDSKYIEDHDSEHHFELEPGSKYRIAVGQPPTQLGRVRGIGQLRELEKAEFEYVVEVHTPARRQPLPTDRRVPTLSPDAEFALEASQEAVAIKQMRMQFDRRPHHRLYLAYREWQMILDMPNPHPVSDESIRKHLGEKVKSNTWNFLEDNLTKYLPENKYPSVYGIIGPKLANPKAGAMARWLVHNGLLTESHVREVQRVLWENETGIVLIPSVG